MWICRAGIHSIYYEKFMSDSRIYLPWNGFDINLASFSDVAAFRNLIITEKKTENRTTISNLSCQLHYFCNVMQIGDYVLIPAFGSREYSLCIIKGDYEYTPKAELPHSRLIEIVACGIKRDFFPQDIQYSLGAFRTIFKVRDENKVLSIIKCRQPLLGRIENV